MVLQALSSLRFSKILRSALAMAIFIAMLFSMMPVFNLEAAAVYETKYGTVTTKDTGLAVRTGAGSLNPYVGTVKKDSKVVIVGEEKDADGTIWYKIEFKSGAGDYGFVSSKFITLYTPEPEVPEGDTPEGDTPEGDTPEGDTPEGDTPEGDTPEGDTPEGDTPEGDTPEGDTPEGDTPEGDTPEGDTPEGDTPEGDTPEGDTPEGDTPEGDTPEGDTPEGDTPEGDTPEGDTPEEETPENEPIDFEAWMNEQGFPESYKEGLRALHEKHPNWVFKAMHVEYEWDYSVEQEYGPSKSLVENSFPSSWKSTENGVYNWETGKWYTYDSGRWVCASREIIKYYMDARNFLDETNIFQFLDQSFDESIHTLEGVEAILAGTFMEGELPDEPGTTYAQLIFETSKEIKFSPYVIAAMIITEQSPTGSPLSSGDYKDYEGYFNFFNIQASGENAIVRGLAHAKKEGWDTRRKSIEAGVKFYVNSYFKKGQTTLYLKRFNVQGEKPFNGQYMTSVYGARLEGALLASGYNEEDRAEALLFTIPVYKSMPETPCTKPTGDGSPNIKLSSLSVENYSLTPDFQPDILEYELVVPADTKTVKISASPMDATAKVEGTGKIKLTDTKKTAKIIVTAENGNTRTYKITIAKEAPGLDNVEFSDKYVLSGTYILAVPGTDTDTLCSTLLTKGTAIVTLGDGSSKEGTDLLKTGDKVIVYNTNDENQGVYVVCVKGDINGDGLIGSSDCIKTRNHMLGKDTLTGVAEAAADVNSDGNISSGDVIKIRNHMLGKALIS